MPREKSVMSRAFSGVLLCILIVMLLAPSRGICLSQGGASLSLLHRVTTTNTSLATDTSKESLFRFDLYQNVPGYGRLFTSNDFSRIDISSGNENNLLSRYQIGLEGFRIGDWKTTMVAGDANMRFTNLIEGFSGPYMSLMAIKPFSLSPFAPEAGRFVNAIYPELFFRGGALSAATEKDSVLLFGGRLSSLKGFQANQMDVTDQTLYGLKWAHQWSKNAYAGIGLAQTRGLLREGAPAGDTVNNTIVLLDGSYRFTDHVKVVGEFKENYFRQDGRDVNDWSIKAGPVLTYQKGSLEFNYRRVGPDFIFFKENLQPERDVEGVFAAGEYRPRENLSLYSSFDWSRTNLEDNRALSAVNSLAALVGGYFSHLGYPSLNLRFSYTGRGSRETSATNVNSRNYTVYLESVYPFKRITPYVRLQGELIKDAVSLESSATVGTAAAGLRMSPLNNVNCYLEGEDQVRNTKSGITTVSVRARGGIAYSPNSRLSMSGDAEYGNVKEKPAGSTLESINLSGRALVTLWENFFLSGDVRYSTSTTQNTMAYKSSSFQFMIGLLARFGWGERGVSPIFLPGGGELVSEVGTIEGFVYQDLNRNGKRDPGEPGLSGIKILLEDGNTTITDAEGKYVFKNVAVGIHQVKINEKDLSASFNLLASPSQRAEVGLRQTVAIQFPLLMSGSFRGRVLIDANGNGQADPDDEPLSDVLVYLEGTPINTFSDADGVFSFENLLPGSYKLRIDTSGLAEGTKLISPEVIAVEIASGGEVKDLVFLAAKEQKRVIKKTFGNK